MNFLQEKYLYKSGTDVINLDYAKAFDKVDQSILLESQGIRDRGESSNKDRASICGRTRTVAVDGKKLSSLSVISEVPQLTRHCFRADSFPALCD
jgi:hypothetical protein